MELHSNSPTVSILIPCFNSERWISRAIESALEQTVPTEVIVVDDGSDDGSLESIKAFHDRIRFETGPNRGGNVARNRLLEMANGEWVQFLDADDYLKPEKIARQLQSVANAKSADVIYSPVSCEVWNGDTIAETNATSTDPGQTLEEQWIRWHVAQTGSMLWKREALQQIGGWNEAFPCCQDNEVTLRGIKNGLNFHYCPSADAVYRIWSDDTVCRRDPNKVIRYRTDLIRQMLAWLDSCGRLTQMHRDAAGQAFFEMARTMAKHDISAADRYATKCKNDQLFRITGPAGPLHYRLIAKTMGFRMAERVAHWRRIES